MYLLVVFNMRVTDWVIRLYSKEKGLLSSPNSQISTPQHPPEGNWAFRGMVRVEREGKFQHVDVMDAIHVRAASADDLTPPNAPCLGPRLSVRMVTQ